MQNNISGVILAGGANMRFGGVIKAKLLIGGKSIISRVTGIIEDVFDEIIIVTNSTDEFKEYDRFKIVGDQFLETGPLGGIHAALKSSTKDSVFVFAGDMPFLERELITDQIDFYNKNNCKVLVPKVNQFIEPLHAIYSKSIEKDLENYLSVTNNYAVKDYIKRIKTCYMLLSESHEIAKAFSNINSPKEIDRFII
jgi:molybdopterin-guanine dinucleotide biosynthesis protein A